MKTSAKTNIGFQNEAEKYAAYLETPLGRLRSDLAFANLEEFLPARQAGKLSRALDLGCGTGTAAVRLAHLGFHVTMFDSSSAMLDIATRTAHDAAISDRVTVKQGDASDLSSLFAAASFDVIVCHNLLEFVDDPVAVLRNVAGVLRGSAAIVSLLVRNQAGEVLKAALQTGDLAAAESSLAAEWGQESLYGGKVRLFSFHGMEALLNEAALTMIAQRGVRVMADYLPPQISRNDEYARILALEHKLGKRLELASVARYTQCLASCASLDNGK